MATTTAVPHAYSYARPSGFDTSGGRQRLALSTSGGGYLRFEGFMK